MKRFVLAMLVVLGACGEPGTQTASYTDVKQPSGHQRSDSALQRATDFCDTRTPRGVNAQVFDQCMLTHGWRYDYTVAGKSAWCYAGVHDCDGEDSACLADPGHLQAVYDLCPDQIIDAAPSRR